MEMASCERSDIAPPEARRRGRVAAATAREEVEAGRGEGKLSEGLKDVEVVGMTRESDATRALVQNGRITILRASALV
jgi:hypothetical protein